MARKRKKTPRFRLEMGWGGVLVVVTGAFAAILWTFVLGIWVGKKVAGPREELNMAAMEAPAATAQYQKTPLFTIDGTSSFEQKAEETSPKRPVTKTENETVTTPPLAPVDAPKPRAEIIQEEIIRKEEATAPEKKAVQAPAQNNGGETQSKGRKPPQTSKRLAKSRPTTYFALQVASFKDLKYAQGEAIRWENLGYDTTVKKANLGPKKGTWYRVFVGRYKTIGEARKGAVELAKKFNQKAYIRPVR